MSYIFSKIQKELFIALTLVLLGATGSQVISNSTGPVEAPYNPYNDRVSQVDTLMQDALLNPEQTDLASLQDTIFATYGSWAGRQTGEQKEDFIAYLEACNQVVISLSKEGNPGLQEKVNLMNELKTGFN